MTEFEYTLTDPLGIHARPAGQLVNEAKKYKCAIKLSTRGKDADAKRIFAVMGLGARCSDTLKVTCEGEDEKEAASALKRLLEGHF